MIFVMSLWLEIHKMPSTSHFCHEIISPLTSGCLVHFIFVMAKLFLVDCLFHIVVRVGPVDNVIEFVLEGSQSNFLIDLSILGLRAHDFDTCWLVSNHSCIGCLFVVKQIVLWFEWIEEAKYTVFGQHVHLNLISCNYVRQSLALRNVLFICLVVSLLNELFDKFGIT